LKHDTIERFLTTLRQASFDVRLDILHKLDKQPIPTKSDAIMSRFVTDYQDRTTKLRSGRFLNMRRGEHRVL